MKKVLVIASHPDDEILGCGGTLIKHKKNKDLVSSIILGEGITSRSDKRDVKKAKIKLYELRLQAKKANKILGINKLIFGNFPDNRFDTVPLLEIIKFLENEIKIIRPDIVYTHYYNDLNIDHRITFNAAVTALRPVSNNTDIYCFETLSSTEFSPGKKKFNPSVFVDITNEIDKKLLSLKEYKTEIKKYPFIRSDKNIKTLASYRGYAANFKYCEAFECIRQYR